MALRTRNLRFIIACMLLLSFFALSSAAQQKTESSPKPKVRAITAFINLDRARYQIQISETLQFLKYVQTVFESRGYVVETLRIATLLDKPSRRLEKIEADYVGFSIPNLFVIGYGMDYAERYRNLPDICLMTPDHPE